MTVRMRHTSSHTKNRRSHHALKGTTIVMDKESGKLRLPHRLDEATGTYRGIQIVSKKELRKAEKKAVKKEQHKHEHVHAEGVMEPVHAEKHTVDELKAEQSHAADKVTGSDKVTKDRKGRARSGS